MRRIYLFARDYFAELPLAWSLARTRDCERNGGHRWTVSTWTVGSHPTRECSRCGCSEVVQTTTGTGNTIPVRLTKEVR